MIGNARAVGRPVDGHEHYTGVAAMIMRQRERTKHLLATLLTDEQLARCHAASTRVTCDYQRLRSTNRTVMMGIARAVGIPADGHEHFTCIRNDHAPT